ncbi:MAG: 5'-methylthioadenosine/S-adenosylhomocysteine nucleosidase [Oscillospiraceae bacterium]|nr:5'-methylthioadenosine/S-adenosylhomocysteine nucleosidase [Oscillospiraceae bacterium]
MRKTVGIIFADSMEYLPFQKSASEKGAKEGTLRGLNSTSYTVKSDNNELDIVAVECGIGKVNAAFAAAVLITECKADIILNAGLSGAISKVKREDIVVGTSYMQCDLDLTAIGYKLAEKPDGEEYIHPADETLLELTKQIGSFHYGKLGTGDIFLTDKGKKELYKELFSLSAFDMETGAIASICRKCGVPFLSIRKISDDADDASSEAYREMNDRAEACLTEILEKLTEKICETM